MCCFFFFNDTATPEIYTLSLHDALPIFPAPDARTLAKARLKEGVGVSGERTAISRQDRVAAELAAEQRYVDRVYRRLEQLRRRSEEHTSELQSRQYLVCRLLLEKKKNNT